MPPDWSGGPLAKAPTGRNGSGMSLAGTEGYWPVYHRRPKRLAADMLLLAAAIAASATQAVPDRQARATVRIVRVEPVRFAEMEQQEPQRLRDAVIRTRDGRTEPARLLEYQ